MNRVPTVSIEVRQLRAAYRTHDVLRDLTLEIRAGRLTAVLGPNGGGKTTLLRVLAGLHPPASGVVRLGGRDLRELPTRERARLVGYLPQQHRAVFPLTVRDVVLSGRVGLGGWRPSPADEHAADEAIAELGLTELSARPYTALSGGEQQRVMIARLLAQRPPVLLLDEPTAHLDLHRQTELMRRMRAWRDAGHTVVAVLHDPNLAFAWADDLVALRDGTLLVCSDPPLWTAARLRELFPAPLDVVRVGERGAVLPSVAVAPWGRPSVPAEPSI
ncbi:MAG: ABC transporter ATP-binding protein [Kiritimatiellae bacterium]|nr:ABC transporter ATP-binding protein [Kiritimatiellia bacterium]